MVSCLAMCTEISLGFQIYSTAKLLHEAVFLNGTMVNMETWPNFSESRVHMFERAEQSLFRKVLNAHSKTPIECLYLELGVTPFRFQLMKRRIMYYQLVMKRNDDEITKAVVMRQKQTRLKGDFYMQVLKDMNALHISERDLLESSKGAMKHEVNRKIHHLAYDYLMDTASKHTKVRCELYKNLHGMIYFDDERFTPDLSNLLFKLRTRMFNVRNNFRNHYKTNLLCPLCREKEDSQEHLLECRTILRKLNCGDCRYEDIFSDDADKLLKIARLFKNVIEIREEEESSMDTEIN